MQKSHALPIDPWIIQVECYIHITSAEFLSIELKNYKQTVGSHC